MGNDWQQHDNKEELFAEKCKGNMNNYNSSGFPEKIDILLSFNNKPNPINNMLIIKKFMQRMNLVKKNTSNNQNDFWHALK